MVSVMGAATLASWMCMRSTSAASATAVVQEHWDQQQALTPVQTAQLTPVPLWLLLHRRTSLRVSPACTAVLVVLATVLSTAGRATTGVTVVVLLGTVVVVMEEEEEEKAE